jgi:thiosulfate/3-mercaptopyruvate sulfurtransferase
LLVSYQWLAEHYHDPDLVILDSRGPVAYSYAHIPNSQPLGLEKIIKINQHGANMVPDTEQATVLFGSLGIDDSKTVVIYGDYLDPSSARIAWTLLYFGHEKTKILDVGIMTWNKNNLPITKDITKPVATNFVAKINKSIRIEADELDKKINTTVIIDARSPQEFLAGRILNSVHLPFTDGVGQDGFLFKDKDELSQIFDEQQIPKDKELVCYCAHGHRASHLFTQLKMAGYENVKLYDGSFVDWVGRRLPLS